VVGWKEDFNMTFSDVIPAQLEAVSYLEKVSEKVTGPLLPGGHSKGGNLAIYASVSCSEKTQKRITGIYCNDAPGFHRNFIKSGGFLKMRPYINSFVPQSSIVGMLFEHGNDYTVIKSSQTGILQHLLYSWEVKHNGMIQLDRVDHGSRFIDKTLRDWMNSLDNERRRLFSETLFGVLDHARIKSFSENENDWLKASFRVIRSMGKIDRATRKNIFEMLTALFNAAKKNIETLIPENKTWKFIP